MSNNSFIKLLFAPTSLNRFLFFFLSDIAIIIFSLYFSFLLRFDFTLSYEYVEMVKKCMPIFITIKLSLFAVFRMYKITWRYVGLRDLFNIVSAVILAQSLLMILILIFLPDILNFSRSAISGLSFKRFPKSIFFIDGLISFLLLSGLRISRRLFFEVFHKDMKKGQGRRTIIVGAGNTGEMILRDMLRQGFSDFYPIGFLDDDKHKVGAYIHGVNVFGTVDKLKNKISKYAVEAVIIAIPSLSHKTLRLIYDTAKKEGIENIKIVPRIYDFHKADISLKNLEDIKIEDLIGRQMVKIEYENIGRFLKDRVILITGAGGSIGSELTIQVSRFHPKRILLFDIDETDLHNLEQKIRNIFPNLFENVHFLVGDVRDNGRVNEVYEKFKPHIVFHAAAYKHVPMMEHNPNEAVKVNMFGTYNLVLASIKYGVEKFVMISTDKAVMPTSIMGATKRMAEYICSAYNNCKNTEFVSVRFGNVLGSRGSVVPLFLEQLKHGGPLTVTHKDMKRYFMTIPEAVSLVLQASVIGRGGEVLVLDMGEPVNIVKLAEELIKIHELKPYEDVAIEFTGLRPGEKLFEDILMAEEGTTATKHEKVFKARSSVNFSISDINRILNEFECLLKRPTTDSEKKTKDLLKIYVKHFNEIICLLGPVEKGHG